MHRFIGISSIKSIVILVLTFAGVLGASCEVYSRQNGKIELGVLEPFYRSAQVQGHIVGQGLVAIPSYLLGNDIDIRYRKNPRLELEIPFTDNFSITRFLGGYRRNWITPTAGLGIRTPDYAIRADDGKLQFRKNVLADRLAPYLQNGYSMSEITLALENTPWALARNGGKQGAYGQTLPPADWKEWDQTVKNFAADIKALSPDGAAPNFKIGNEYDTKKSFDGTADDYFQYYSIAFKRLRDEFPSSAIVPGEFTGTGNCMNPRRCVYSTRQFVKTAKQDGFPPSYVPRSLNAVQNSAGSDAFATAVRAKESYAGIDANAKEVHQFGLLGQPFGSRKEFGNDEGARAAAWEFITLMELKRDLNPKRVFHWETLVDVDETDTPLLNGAGYTRLLLDQYLGRKLAILPTVVESGRSETLAVSFQSKNATAVLIGASNLSSDASSVSMKVDLSSLPAHGRDWRFVRYAEDKTVFARMKRDLADDHNLKPEFDSCAYCTATPIYMALDLDRAEAMIKRSEGEYVDLMKQGLRFKNVAEDPGISFAPDGQSVSVKMASNELLLLDR